MVKNGGCGVDRLIFKAPILVKTPMCDISILIISTHEEFNGA